jgi:hypothetical protein
MVIAECDALIPGASAYSKEHLEDMPKIRDWNWNSRNAKGVPGIEDAPSK